MRFAPGGFYHIVNRGVDGRILFPQKTYYERFKNGLIAFNSPKPVELRFLMNTEVGPPKEPLVDVVSYCLMKDHVHMLIRVLKREKDTALFLQKLFGGFTMYFNIRHKRKGVLFQGKALAKHIDKPEYLDHVLRYIHLNPLDYIDKRWREHGVGNVKLARKEILLYPWSSISAAVNGDVDTIVNTALLRELILSGKDFLDDMLEWSAGDFQVVRKQIYGGRTSVYGGSTSEELE